MAHTLFQPCSTLFQPFWATAVQLDLKIAIFGHLWSDKVVRVVSPNAPYPVPTLFHLVPTALDHLDLINGILVHFDPFLTQKGVLGVQKII